MKQTGALVGSTIGHYAVLSLIGTGGMGEVYRARDTRLDRIAALKILPADIGSDPARIQRFVSEAKAASALAGHGVFDFFHHLLIQNPGAPVWWPGFCLSFDVLAGGFLAMLLMRRSGFASTV